MSYTNAINVKKKTFYVSLNSLFEYIFFSLFDLFRLKANKLNILKKLVKKTLLLDKVYGAVQKLCLPLERALLQANSVRLEGSYSGTIFVYLCFFENNFLVY